MSTGEYYHLIEGQHKEECPELPIYCPNECDTGSISQDDMLMEDIYHRKNVLLKSKLCNVYVCYAMGCHVTSKNSACPYACMKGIYPEKMEVYLFFKV